MNIGFCGVSTRSPRSRKKERAVPKHEEIDFPMISPTFFRGLSIYVNMEDQQKKDIVKKTLQITGSSVIEDPTAKADLIVTDKPVSLPPTTSAPRSRGQKLVAACAHQPQFIRTEQIPWAFMTERMAPPPAPQDRSKLLVVADALGVQRPKFKLINNNIALHFEENKTCGCPFDAPSHSEKKKKDTDTVFKLPEGPPDDGYCQICKLTYKNAAEHKKSQTHIEKVSDTSLFASFDQLASSIWKENRFSL